MFQFTADRLLIEADRLVAATVADPESPDEIRQHAVELREQLTRDGGTIALELSGRVDGAVVRVDGDEVPAETYEAILVQGGRAHALEVERRGAVVATEEITVEAGATRTVALAIAPSADELAAEAEANDDSGSGLDLTFAEDWRFWAITGGAVAAVALTIIIAVVASDNAGLQSPIVGDFQPGVITWD